MVAALAMAAMLVMVAFVVDIGKAYLVQRQLQAGVDAAALAGAQHLPDPTDATTVAQDDGPSTGEKNEVKLGSGVTTTVTMRCVKSAPGCNPSLGNYNAVKVQAPGNEMTWFEKIIPAPVSTERRTRSVPEGLWMKCPACDSVLYRPEVERNLQVCPKCADHMRIRARQRFMQFLDLESYTQIGAEVAPEDPLRLRDSKRYRDRLTAAEKAVGERDALVVMSGTLEGLDVVAGAFEFSFMGGSMGSVVGERFVRGVEHAIANRTPLVCFSASGGARMQEGLLSLMQMAKTSAALAALAAERLPFISVQTDPTTGGVSASLAMLGDVNIAEPKALIGFAGPRVIQQTVRETLPEGFQRSEFLLDHGAIDMILDRRDLRERIASLLRILLRRPAASG